jgi:hypothetical protein
MLSGNVDRLYEHQSAEVPPCIFTIHVPPLRLRLRLMAYAPTVNTSLYSIASLAELIRVPSYNHNSNEILYSQD